MRGTRRKPFSQRNLKLAKNHLEGLRTCDPTSSGPQPTRIVCGTLGSLSGQWAGAGDVRLGAWAFVFDSMCLHLRIDSHASNSFHCCFNAGVVIPAGKACGPGTRRRRVRHSQRVIWQRAQQRGCDQPAERIGASRPPFSNKPRIDGYRSGSRGGEGAACFCAGAERPGTDV
jgi:hypothetical protein